MQQARWITPWRRWAWIAACAIAFHAVVVPTASAQTTGTPAGTLARIRKAGRVNFGYRIDARPFSYRDESVNAAGYSVAMCTKVADALKAELGLPTLDMQWVPLTLEERFTALEQGKVDVLCGADAPTLERRKTVAFSIPIFPGGIGALLRSDSPTHLRDVLSGRSSTAPTWRASAGQLLSAQTFSVVGGTTAQQWLAKKQHEFQLNAQVVPVDNYAAGVQQLLERKANVFFADRAILLDAAARSPSASKLLVLDRLFTYEPLALTLGRGDEDFRLVVDRTLSRLYASGEIVALYTTWFGLPDANALTFFRWNTVPE